jgi:hypothetical protein
MWRVLSIGANEAGIRSVIGGAGGLGTTAFRGGQKSSKAVNEEAKNERIDVKSRS